MKYFILVVFRVDWCGFADFHEHLSDLRLFSKTSNALSCLFIHKKRLKKEALFHSTALTLMAKESYTHVHLLIRLLHLAV